MDLNVGHLQQSTASAITGATLQFSLDGGASWQNASVAAQGKGAYRASFLAESPDFRGVHVDLRVSATDANGGQITETLSRAFKTFD
ncbi:hypothetical protein LWC34_50230 [Kibdelosporangium philippinense]|uniref:Mo-co oxidoreductase dimerisation domain-containing protein n=2 Tax=Kibdelosporangium philippinense TaxID=211113 RepID=A0ABS8ZWG7_9PSEU|nr:hypothetical protein [Kibdelosporangium philippinense]MCE7010931.1 hypothetical protein [Kibdelosporangium philippinense]